MALMAQVAASRLHLAAGITRSRGARAPVSVLASSLLCSTAPSATDGADTSDEAPRVHVPQVINRAGGSARERA